MTIFTNPNLIPYIGRVPSTVGLGLDVAGIETDRGFLQVANLPSFRRVYYTDSNLVSSILIVSMIMLTIR